MSELRKIFISGGSALSSGIVSSLITFLTSIMIARYLGVELYGKYSFVIAFCMLFASIQWIISPYILTRELSKPGLDHGTILGNAFLIRIPCAFILFVIIAGIAQFLDQPWFVKFCILSYALTLGIMGCFEPISSVFASRIRLEYHAICAITERVLALSITYLIIQLGLGFISLFLRLVLTNLLMLLLGIALSLRFLRPKLNLNLGLCRFLILESLPLLASGYVGAILGWTDQVMVSLIVGDRPLGYYSVALGLAKFSELIALAMNSAIFPVISRYYNSSQRLAVIYRLGVHYASMIAFPLGVGTMLFSDRIVTLFYSGEYLPAANALNILIWVFGGFLLIGGIFGYLLVGTGRQIWVLFTTSISTGLNIPLNLILIPQMEYMGAAVASLISYGAGFFLGYLIVSKYVHKLNLAKICVRPAIAALGMGSILYVIGRQPLSLLIPAGLGIYLLILYAIGGITEEDLELIRKLIRGE